MQKYDTLTSSIIKRISQFENSNSAIKSESKEMMDDESTASLSHKKLSDGLLAEEKSSNTFLSVAFDRFKKEFSSLYPDYELPFEQLNTIDQAKDLLLIQKQHIIELNKELIRSKFTIKFLEEIIIRDEKDLGINFFFSFISNLFLIEIFQIVYFISIN